MRLDFQGQKTSYILLMITLIETDQTCEDLMSNGIDLFDEKDSSSIRRVSTSVLYSFPNDLFAHAHAHICHQVIPDYTHSIVYVVSVQPPILAVRRYVLVLESKKKQDEKHVLILQRTDPIVPHASPEPFSRLSMANVAKASLPFVRPFLTTIRHRMMSHQIVKSLLPFVLRHFVFENHRSLRSSISS